MADSDPEIERLSRKGGTSRDSQGHCAQNEARLFEYLDGILTAEEFSAVKAHLATCPECQALSEEWQRLDFELGACLAPPSLSPNFRTRVWQAIGAEPDSALARKRAQLRADWEADWADHRRRFLRAHFPALLDKLGYGVLASMAMYFVLRLCRPLWSLSTDVTTSLVQQWVAPLGLGLAALSLIAAYVVAAKKPLRRWLGAL
jgi:anti-sigma factor RsiW